MAALGQNEGKAPVTTAKTLEKEFLPRHVAIIMDGNGRWAQKRGMPRTFGHKAGVEALREIIKYSDELGVEALTIYQYIFIVFIRSVFCFLLYKYLVHLT